MYDRIFIVPYKSEILFFGLLYRYSLSSPSSNLIPIFVISTAIFLQSTFLTILHTASAILYGISSMLYKYIVASSIKLF